jgi:hypothetical protein
MHFLNCSTIQHFVNLVQYCFIVTYGFLVFSLSIKFIGLSINIEGVCASIELSVAPISVNVNAILLIMVDIFTKD